MKTKFDIYKTFFPLSEKFTMNRNFKNINFAEIIYVILKIT